MQSYHKYMISFEASKGTKKNEVAGDLFARTSLLDSLISWFIGYKLFCLQCQMHLWVWMQPISPMETLAIQTRQVSFHLLLLRETDLEMTNWQLLLDKTSEFMFSLSPPTQTWQTWALRIRLFSQCYSNKYLHLNIGDICM